MTNAIYQIRPNAGAGLIELGMNLRKIHDLLKFPMIKLNDWDGFERYVFDKCFIEVAINHSGFCSAIMFGFNSPVTLVLDNFIFFEGLNWESIKSIDEVFQFMRQVDDGTLLLSLKGSSDDPGSDWGCISRDLRIGACSNEEEGIDSVVVFDDDFYQNCLIDKWSLRGLI